MTTFAANNLPIAVGDRVRLLTDLGQLRADMVFQVAHVAADQFIHLQESPFSFLAVKASSLAVVPYQRCPHVADADSKTAGYLSWALEPSDWYNQNIVEAARTLHDRFPYGVFDYLGQTSGSTLWRRCEDDMPVTVWLEPLFGVPTHIIEIEGKFFI